MRPSDVLVTTFALALLASPAAEACAAAAPRCPPAVVVFPAYTPEGVRIGTVEARLVPPYPLARSPFTGQPLTVVYNDPARTPWSVDPEVEIVTLPRAARFHTKAVYPRGP